jgi:hypothetical protein
LNLEYGENTSLINTLSNHLFKVKSIQNIKSRDLIWFDKGDESKVSKKQDNKNIFVDMIENSDSVTKINTFMAKKPELETKKDPDIKKIYNQMKKLIG